MIDSILDVGTSGDIKEDWKVIKKHMKKARCKKPDRWDWVLAIIAVGGFWACAIWYAFVVFGWQVDIGSYLIGSYNDTVSDWGRSCLFVALISLAVYEMIQHDRRWVELAQKEYGTQTNRYPYKDRSVSQVHTEAQAYTFFEFDEDEQKVRYKSRTVKSIDEDRLVNGARRMHMTFYPIAGSLHATDGEWRNIFPSDVRQT